MRRVVVTGMGIVSPIGNSVAEVRRSLVEGRSGVRAMDEWRAVRQLKSFVAAAVDNIDPRRIDRGHRRTMGRMSVMAAFASMDAVADAGLDKGLIKSGRAGVAFGSTTGSPEIFQQFFGGFIARGLEGMEGTLFMKVMGHSAAANVAAVLDARGRLIAPCSACASSTQAIGAGWEAIAAGYQDIMICGGAEELHPTTAGVFDVLYAASRGFNDAPHRTPRPFDRDRDGLVPGEGAAALVLEDYESAMARGARIHGEIIGYATTCDPSNMVHPGKEGMLACMGQALESAGISKADVDYINAHATGTVIGDAAEAEVTREIFGDRVPVSSTKGYTGHTLAACGAMEAIFCLVMMRDGFIAPTLNLENIDDGCKGLAHVRAVADSSPRIAMSNNFAFGGVNATLILRTIS